MSVYATLSQHEARARLGDDLPIQLGNLTALAFSSFEGVVRPSPDKTRWYLARPGMDDELSSLILAEGHVVSNVYVTRLRFPVAGQTFDVGMIDTVMTHPNHRQQGLAARLLSRALDGLRASGAAGATLYTPPGSLPFSIYQKMGFQLYRPCSIWTLEGALPASVAHVKTRVARAGDEIAIRALINRFNAARDGYLALDQALWDWRKLKRPTHMPVTIVTAHRSGHLVGVLTFCPVDLIAASGPSCYMYLTDLGLAEDEPVEILAALLRTSPPAARWIMLASECDRELNALLKELRFTAAPTEGFLALPFDPAFGQALESSTRSWYVLPESVVGV